LYNNKIGNRFAELTPLESSQKTLDELGKENLLTNFL
jgi:hypothetical protein